MHVDVNKLFNEHYTTYTKRSGEQQRFMLDN